MEKQSKSINIARGIGIILVVLGHSITRDMADASLLQYIVRTIVYTVHMPLFFFLSGYLFESRHEAYFSAPAWDHIRTRASRFMLPYLSFSLINYGIVYLCSFVPAVSAILSSNGYVCGSLSEVIAQILTFSGHVDTHLWFCYVMFLVIVGNRLFIRNNDRMVLGLLVLLCGIRCVWLSAGHQLPEIINYYMHFMYLFSAGRLWFGYRNRQKSLNSRVKTVSAVPRISAVSGALAVISLTGIIITGKTGMIAAETVLTFAAELSSCVFILEFISAKAEAVIDRRGMRGSYEGQEMPRHEAFAAWLAQKTERVGRSDYSFPLYLIHMPFIVSGCIVVFTRLGLPVPLVVCISTSAGTAVSLVIRAVIMRYDAAKRVLFGMK